MRATRPTRENADLERRLEAYFATLRPAALREVLKRSAASWHFYAAVTGSAMAMATGISAAVIGTGAPAVAEPAANALAATQHFATANNVPLMSAIRAAMARQNAFGPAANAAVQGTQAAVSGPPTISPGGVVPIFSSTNTIEPGEWVSIYGTNLASSTVVWNGDFPISLGGTKVEINGKPAYLMFVSPGQINLQAPDDAARGSVSVVVTTAAGSATSSVTLASVAPSFSLFEPTGQTVLPMGYVGFVCGIIVRSDKSGAYGGGTYDVLGPTGNSLGFPTVAALPGDIVELFGVGFGPTTQSVPAGKPFVGAAPLVAPFTLYINNVAVKPSFVGISSTGLYQINLTVPDGLGDGDVPIYAVTGGEETQRGVLFSLERAVATLPYTATIVPIGTFPPPSFGFTSPGPPPPPTSFGTPGPGTMPGTPGPGTMPGTPGPGSPGPGTFGGSPGTDGASGRAHRHTKPYSPKMRFPNPSK